MKVTTPARAVPNDAHALYTDFFGNDNDFELSTIRPEDASIAIEMLIGNYSAPRDAVIRELVVNAIDSHRAVGRQEPVEIVMPTRDEPLLIVRDRGLGLSPTDMVGVYTRPAASTKRDEDFSTGGLGIGAKAPFTVVDRFLVRGVKDGVAATLTMARIDGQLKHRVDDIKPVDDGTPNGVEVIVPVNADVESIESWWKALSRVHFWWDEGLVTIVNKDASPVNLPGWQERLLDGEDPGALPQIVVSPKLATSTVLMGQIGYRIPSSVTQTASPVLYRLPVGAVTIAPTRESIVDTEENRKLLGDLYYAWQDEVFEPISQKLADPSTSIWSLFEIQRALGEKGTLDHFGAWIRRTEGSEEGRLPGHYGLHYFAKSLLPNPYSPRDRRFDVCLHGLPEEAGARWRSLADVLTYAGNAQYPPTVFCDSDTLPEAKRKILTKWARQENVITVVVSRKRLEAARFSRTWGWFERPELTRPFANPGELEWTYPDQIRVARAPRKRATPVTERSTVEVHTLNGRHERRQMTVRELVDQVASTPNGYVIVDTLEELKELPHRLPGSILIVQSGQRPAKLVRDLADKRALTAEQFRAKQAEIVLRSLTRAQRRWVADAELAYNEGVSLYFQQSTQWIEQIEDLAVREVAQKISKIVKQANAYRSPYSEASKRDKRLRSGVEYRAALATVLQDPRWLIANGALGQYLPALMAAQSRGFERIWGHQQLVIEHICATIASQIVAG